MIGFKEIVRTGADFVVVSDAAHNLMMEHNYRETAETIHNWLSACEIV